MKKTLTLLVVALLTAIQSLTAQERRPIDSQHPLWFIHVDVWYKADPQKIIDLIPEDIRPYVCLNLSLSCQYDKTKNQYKMPHYAFQTYTHRLFPYNNLQLLPSFRLTVLLYPT